MHWRNTKKVKKEISLSITIATERDCAELGIMNRAMADDGGANNNMTVLELQERMKKFMKTNYIAVFFVVNGERVGYALIDKTCNPMFIRQFFIKSEFRRKGYGTAAFKEILRYFNIDQISLSVLKSNTIGQKFWDSCGLIPYEIVMHYCRGGQV